MRRIFLALLLVATAVSAQTIAARRYAEKTPEQYVFGAMTALAPFNNQPNYASAALANVQPSALITSNNTCASTANFTVLAQTSPAATFSTASNICTVATGSSGGVYILGDANSSFTVPVIFVSVQISTAGSYEFGPVLSNATGSMYLMADLYNATSCNLVIYNGSYSNVSLNSCTAPGAGGYVGLSLVGNDACMWISTNGTAWTNTGCGSTSGVYNFETVGNLTGIKAGVRLTAASTTWKFQNLVSGGFGGVGVRDVSLVTYADGRPYMAGAVAYFAATTCDPLVSCYDGIFSYNTGTSALTQIGAIINTRGGAYAGDDAGHLIYDPGNGNFRYLVGGFNWGTTSSGTYYGSWASSTFNPLTQGIGAVAATTVTSFPTYGSGWDMHMACTAWNYSAGTCGKWTAGQAASSTIQQAAYTTSDPSLNTWTSINTAAGNYAEGDRLTRTATGNGGVLYETAFVNAAGPSSDNLTWHTYSASAFTSVGTITGQPPGGFANPPHPQIFSYGNTEYLVSFNNVLWNAVGNTMGDWLITSTPKYSAQPSNPQFVASATVTPSSGSTASVTTASAVTVTVGDLVTVFCRGQNGTATSVAVSSSASVGTFTGIGFNTLSTSGYDEGFYTFATTGGSSTFTCTPNASSTFQGIVAMVFHPASLTTLDTSSHSTQSGTSNLFTSAAFSTTAKGLVVVCGEGLFGGSLFEPGFIGPYASGPSAGTQSNGAACESVATPSAQSGITATMGWGAATAGMWGGAVMAFK